VARYGSDGPAYSSGSVCACLKEVMRRGSAAGFFARLAGDDEDDV
jgi:hypothetical protein